MSSRINFEGGELRARFALARKVLAQSPEPLHVPFGVEFTRVSGDRFVNAWANFAERARSGAVFPAATLYVHIPFCARVCSYCLLSSSRTPGKGPVDAYVLALRRQIAMMAPVVRGLSFSSLHIGGGTPTLLSEAQLDALLTDLRQFDRAPNFQIGVEAHPGTATATKLELLARHGVDRVSFGVESFTPAVLRNVNREDQTEERVRTAIAAARRAGLSVNVDMLAGLPGETRETFADSMRKALDLEPDSMSVNRFLAENSPLARMGYGPNEADNRLADRMLLDADALIRSHTMPRWPARPLELPGFGTQYVWDRSDKARTYFQDDMIGPASTLALGHGALGHIHGQCFSVAAGSHLDFVAQLSNDKPADTLTSDVSTRFEMAFYAADRACRGDLSFSRFTQIFREDARTVFGRELAFLTQVGLLRIDGDKLSKPPNMLFQVTHLLAFLLKRSDQLMRDLEHLSLGAPSSPPAAERRAVQAARRSLLTSECSTVDIIANNDEDVQRLADAVQAARGAGATTVALWAPVGVTLDVALQDKLVGAGADELIVSEGVDGHLPEGTDELCARLPGLVTIRLLMKRGSVMGERLTQALARGVRHVLIDVDEGLSSEEIAVLSKIAAEHKIKLEFDGNGRAELAQYEAIRAELPPSLLWCRIAMRAAQAMQGQQRLAVRRMRVM